MLVLSRRKGERIMVGDVVSITVIGINGGTVRLAIDAPQAVPVVRHELLYGLTPTAWRAQQQKGGRP